MLTAIQTPCQRPCEFCALNEVGESLKAHVVEDVHVHSTYCCKNQVGQQEFTIIYPSMYYLLLYKTPLYSSRKTRSMFFYTTHFNIVKVFNLLVLTLTVRVKTCSLFTSM